MPWTTPAATAFDETIYRTIVDSVSQGMWLSDPAGHVRFFNAHALAWLGASSAEVEGHRWLDRVHDEDRARVREAHESAIARGEAYVVDARFRRHDGVHRWHRFSVTPLRAAGQVVGWVGSALDLDDDRQRDARRELAEREERLRAALDASRTGTFRWDIRTNALDWDDNLDRLFGLEPGKSVHSLDGFLAVVHPDDRQRVVDACGRCAATGEDFDEEFRVVRPDGSVHVLHDIGRTYRDATGAPAWMTGACVDVTERRRQEEELRALAETVPLLVWMATPTGRVDYVNSRWTEYTGTTAAQLTGGTSSVIHVQDVPDMQDRWMQAVATGEPFEATYRIRRADGEYRWFVSRARATRDDGGRVTRWFGSCTDIHDEVAMRERLEGLNAEAEAARAAAQEANRTKGAFLAMMSHDLRTPINATLGYVDLLLLGVRGELTEAQRGDLERLRRAQHALLALVNEVLDYTRLDAAKVEYRLAPIPVAPLVAEVGGIVEVLAHGRGLAFEMAPVPEGLTLVGDRDRVQQILLNLLTNATKFTDAGGAVRMSVEAVEGRVRLHVTDTGRGIPADRLPVVFEPFVQVGRAEPGRPAHGVGLGLAIARGLARGMDGDLTATSIEGEGSTFTLELPRG